MGVVECGEGCSEGVGEWVWYSVVRGWVSGCGRVW